MVKAKDLEKVKTLEDLTRLKDPKGDIIWYFTDEI